MGRLLALCSGGGSGNNTFVGKLRVDNCRVGTGHDRFVAGLFIELDIPRIVDEGCLVFVLWVAWRRVQWVDLVESW